MTLAFKARTEDPAVASFRYRVLEPVAFLRARGHAVELYRPARFEDYQAVVFSKAYGARDIQLARRLKAAGKLVILDLCDDHFHNPENLPKYEASRRKLIDMIRLADAVVCSTPVLAEAVQREAKLETAPAVAPDVYEQAATSAGEPTPRDRPARLLWFGRHGSPNAPAGMGDLLLIRDALAEAFAKRPFEMVVCSDSRERFDALFGPGSGKAFVAPVRYVTWTPDRFAAELGAADAAIIPLSDNPFVAAKTHNRLSLVLSAGVPVVADPLDSYREFAPFAYIGDWSAGLEAVLLRPEEARAKAAGARGYLEANWSAQAVAPRWEAALGLPGGRPSKAVDAKPPADIADWLAGEGRADRPWLLAGEDADPEAVAQARAAGYLVMSLGRAFQHIAADLAYVIDAEDLAADPAALERNVRVLLAPRDLHVRGAASGRSLESWAADLPALARLLNEGRLVSFELWTGRGRGVFGNVEGEAIPLKLLAGAGARTVLGLGIDRRTPSATGFEALTSVLDRQEGPDEGLSYGPYEAA